MVVNNESKEDLRLNKMLLFCSSFFNILFSLVKLEFEFMFLYSEFIFSIGVIYYIHFYLMKE